MSCSICLDTFNKSTRSPTKCPYCPIETCRTCLQTYLLNDISDVPRCVNPECEHGYTREFLDSQLTQSFRLHTYKVHREKVISDRERARLPDTQEDAQAYKQAKTVLDELSEKMAALQTTMDELLTSEVKTANETIHRYSLQHYLALMKRPLTFAPVDPATHALATKCVRAYKAKLYPFRRQMAMYRTEYSRTRHTVDTYGRRRTEANTVETQIQRQAFIKPCPANGCNGFLSTAWKCGLCNMWACPECHDLKGDNRDAEHTCDPNKVLTAKLLEKEAKGCPKCGVQICKIEGCDQMWCTHCNTGFNWRTGKVASGPVHNPHYFEWLRGQGITQTTQPAPNLANPCDYTMDRTVSRALTTGEHDVYLQEVWRLTREAEGYGGNAQPDYTELFRILRVRYMAGELLEADWKVALQRLEKDTHFQQANNQIKEVFIQASRDLIRQILEPEQDRAQIRKQVEELVEYCNNSAANVTKRFNRKARTYNVRLPNRIGLPMPVNV